ncbi:hypothetical protein Plhal304r1_c014g0051971 [Plasmopara halstedii]
MYNRKFCKFTHSSGVTIRIIFDILNADVDSFQISWCIRRRTGCAPKQLSVTTLLECRGRALKCS